MFLCLQGYWALLAGEPPPKRQSIIALSKRGNLMGRKIACANPKNPFSVI
tara:strand:- start:172 stop:321 length:150 start_codon:yes stop_codon:yes gene_type:complete